MWIKLNFGLTNLFSTQKYILDKNYFSSKEIVVPVYFQGKKKCFNASKTLGSTKFWMTKGEMSPAQVCLEMLPVQTSLEINCGQYA